MSQSVELGKRERYGSVEEGEGNGMLLAMLVSHYSTAAFVKWRDNTDLRPYVSAFTHKDSHAARLMLLCLCYHRAYAPVAVFVLVSAWVVDDVYVHTN